MEPIWTDGEKEQLKELCAKNKTLSKIAREIPGKTESQIRTKCKNMGLEFNKKRKKWSDEELAQFKADWVNHSISSSRLRSKYKNRSLTALRACARRLGLAERPYDDSYLRINDIVIEMGVSKDRVRLWIKNGLKYRKSHIRPVKYLISTDDLLEFLKSHPSCYDASKISKYIFNPEPDWLKKKRVADAECVRTKSKKAEYYGDAECRRMIEMFKKGMSNAEIGKELDRTESGVERMLGILGLSRKRYNDYELDIIRHNHDKITIDEIVAMLPLRTRSGVIAKCEQLKLKYKTIRKPRRKRSEIMADNSDKNSGNPDKKGDDSE